MPTLYDFGDAIRLIKQGMKMKRQGWNGQDQFVSLATHISFKCTWDNGETLTETTVNPDHKDIGNNALVFFGSRGVQVGWLASQADMLAEDWMIVD